MRNKQTSRGRSEQIRLWLNLVRLGAADTSRPVPNPAPLWRIKRRSPIGETSFALDPIESVGPIDAREGLGGLIEELHSVTSKFEVPQLFGHNNVDNHRSLVR
jgi:hypothetical protein